MKTQKQLIRLFFILTFTTTFPDINAQDFNPPQLLRSSKWCYNYNFLWADPDSTIAAFQHYNVYKDDVLTDSTLLNYCTMEFETGSHTFGVSAVYEGGESAVISIALESPSGKIPRLINILSEEGHIGLTWWSTFPHELLTYMHNLSGNGYYPSDFTSADSITYAIKSNWDYDIVEELTSFEFMPGIIAGNGALDYHFKIFQGDSLPQLIYFKDLNNIQNNQMNKIIIDPPLIINTNENILLAVTFINNYENMGSMMVDDMFPAPGLGNLFCIHNSGWNGFYESGVWVMTGDFSTVLWYGDNHSVQLRETNEGIVNQYDIYRNGEFLTSSSNSILIDTNFSEADCGKYFEYYITATYPTCTSSPSDTVGILLDCTSGLSDAGNENSVRIYPNPANEVLNIESEYPIEKLTLTDLFGHVLLTPLRKTGKINQIKISNLSSGVYLLKIMSNGLMHSEKVIVMPQRY